MTHCKLVPKDNRWDQRNEYNDASAKEATDREAGTHLRIITLKNLQDVRTYAYTPTASLYSASSVHLRRRVFTLRHAISNSSPEQR